MTPSGEPQRRVIRVPSTWYRSDSATSPAGPAATLARLVPSPPANASGRAAQPKVVDPAIDGLALAGTDGRARSLAAADGGGESLGDTATEGTLDAPHPSTAIATKRTPAASGPACHTTLGDRRYKVGEFTARVYRAPVSANTVPDPLCRQPVISARSLNQAATTSEPTSQMVTRKRAVPIDNPPGSGGAPKSLPNRRPAGTLRRPHAQELRHAVQLAGDP